jgi:hypothetical protein
MLSQILINSKCDQSWKGEYIQLMWKEKIIIRRENYLLILMKGWLEGAKLKCPAIKSCVEVTLKDCQMPLSIKY